MKRVLCSALLSGALLVALPTAAFAHDGHERFEHRHHYSCWGHRWGHEHHMDHHFGRYWECDRW